METELSLELEALRAAGLYRETRLVEGAQGPRVELDVLADRALGQTARIADPDDDVAGHGSNSSLEHRRPLRLNQWAASLIDRQTI